VKTLRLTLALLFLVASLTLLAWGSMPNRREVRRQFIEPTEMQLPAPEGFLPEIDPILSTAHLENQQTAKIAACFVLISRKEITSLVTVFTGFGCQT
jgi:hypothetical protein